MLYLDECLDFVGSDGPADFLQLNKRIVEIQCSEVKGQLQLRCALPSCNTDHGVINIAYPLQEMLAGAVRQQQSHTGGVPLLRRTKYRVRHRALRLLIKQREYAKIC